MQINSKKPSRKPQKTTLEIPSKQIWYASGGILILILLSTCVIILIINWRKQQPVVITPVAPTTKPSTATDTFTPTPTNTLTPTSTVTATATATATTTPSTNVPITLAPPVNPVSLDLYLPDYLVSSSGQIKSQIEEFQKIYPGVVVNLNFSSNLREQLRTMAMAGNLPAMAALKREEVIEFSLSDNLVPITTDNMPQYLEEAVTLTTVDKSIFGYPWQRYSCSPDYLNLVVFNNLSPNVLTISRALGEFLTNFTNQKINQSDARIPWYPTLREFYGNGLILCPTVVPLPPEPRFIPKIISIAQDNSKLFSEIANVEFAPLHATGLDTIYIDSQAGGIADVLVPVSNNNQPLYKNQRQVMGLDITQDNRSALTGMSIISKSTIQYLGLPLGAYMIACDLERPNDCIAITPNGQEFQLEPDLITRLDLPDPVRIPTVSIEQGSKHKCFTILKVKICIKVF